VENLFKNKSIQKISLRDSSALRNKDFWSCVRGSSIDRNEWNGNVAIFLVCCVLQLAIRLFNSLLVLSWLMYNTV
jgi:hypothetical protein